MLVPSDLSNAGALRDNGADNIITISKHIISKHHYKYYHNSWLRYYYR